jgi:hypothetical protein
VQQLKKFGKPTFLADQQVATACILLAMQAMGGGFNAAGMAPTWKKIHNQLKVDQKFYGTDLQIMLQQLGWKIYYWNPDPSKNAQWDAEDKALTPLKPGRKWMPVWGGHELRYASAKIRASTMTPRSTILRPWWASRRSSLRRSRMFLPMITSRVSR